LKRQFQINDFSLEGLSEYARGFLKKLEVVLLDSSVLCCMVYDEADDVFYPLGKLGGWDEMLGASRVCVVCDFIKIECFNVERTLFRDVKIRRFLKGLAKCDKAFYVELKTPIKKFSADDRKRLLDLFPRKYRHVLIKKYGDLSGTDVCLLLVALYLKSHGISVSIATRDRILAEASEELEIKIAAM